MKAEPNSRIEKGVDVKFSIDDLEKARSPEPWDGNFPIMLYIYNGKNKSNSRIGVRNHTGKMNWAAVLLMSNDGTAKNHMKTMKKGDLAFFYHSNCKIPGVAGIMEIIEEATVDGKSDVAVDVCREHTG